VIPTSVADRVLALAADLRRAGVDASLAEVLDALEALAQLELIDRALVHLGLQSTLIKRAEDVEVFDVLFDRHFPLTAPHASGVAVRPSVAGTAGPGNAAGGPGPVARDVQVALVEALCAADATQLRLLVGEAVTAYAGMDVHEAGERYYVHRVLRALDLAELHRAVIARQWADHEDMSAAELRRFGERTRVLLEQYRRLLAAEIRDRLARAAPAGRFQPRVIEDVDLMRATSTELRELRAAVRPLARKLASRIGRQRRRHRHGRLDMRTTLRRSLAAGGTPFEPALRRPRRTKPRLVVLCDISGSVADFARFTLMLLDALRSEVAGLRTFVFVDGVAEVTAVLERADVALDPRLLVTLPGVVADDGHSDYERALRSFVERFDDALGPAATVLVAGDARTNYRGPGLDSLRAIRRNCRRLYWFNPEPADEWGDADSQLPAYAELCDGVFEVRTLGQLADAVAAIV
jgi:uncharacterized protein with von Willebrand factor type A (vWA) domain